MWQDAVSNGGLFTQETHNLDPKFFMRQIMGAPSVGNICERSTHPFAFSDAHQTFGIAAAGKLGGAPNCNRFKFIGPTEQKGDQLLI